MRITRDKVTLKIESIWNWSEKDEFLEEMCHILRRRISERIRWWDTCESHNLTLIFDCEESAERALRLIDWFSRRMEG